MTTDPHATLNRRLDALLTLIRASRDEHLLAQLEARAGIVERDLSMLLVKLYWWLVNGECKETKQ